MLYIATRYDHEPNDRGHRGKTRQRFGTLKAARLWAKSSLGSISTTRYNVSRDLGRAPFVGICECPPGHPSRRDSAFMGGKHIEHVEPEIHIVPSVGELGYW